MSQPQESRVKKTLLNARVNTIFYFLILILSFFSRKIFLDTLGADFIGLTGTMQNLLGFLNLAELGIATAIGYVLYAPLHQKDQSKINEIISVFGYSLPLGRPSPASGRLELPPRPSGPGRRPVTCPGP